MTDAHRRRGLALTVQRHAVLDPALREERQIHVGPRHRYLVVTARRVDVEEAGRRVVSDVEVAPAVTGEIARDDALSAPIATIDPRSGGHIDKATLSVVDEENIVPSREQRR